MLNWIRTRDYGAALGLITIDGEIVETIRKRVHAKLAGHTFAARRRSLAEAEIEDLARWEIVSAFRDAHPGRSYKPTRTWPDASCILADDGWCLVRLWIGHDFSDAEHGISPVSVRVSWRIESQPKPKTATNVKSLDRIRSNGARRA